MDEKINREAMTAYGDTYANKVLQQFFSSKEKISGPEILSFCNIQQVNLFVIRELFKAWKEETGKLRSAFFDYDHPEVKEALGIFMSVLSNHISLDKMHFETLLKKAVQQTLMVIFNPYDFYSMLIAGKNNRLEIASFREEIKYLRINKAPLEKMLHKLEEKKVTEIPGNEAFAILDQILEEVNFTPEDLDTYTQKFSSVVPLDPSAFYTAKTTESSSTLVSEEHPVQNRESTVAINEKKVVFSEKSTDSTINDRLTHAKQSALADNLRKISKIKESLTINQKFMFTKVLFYGDFESFSRVVDDIDQLSDINAALQYLENHSSTWDRESREFHEFMEMIEKRFT